MAADVMTNDVCSSLNSAGINGAIIKSASAANAANRDKGERVGR